MLQTALADWHKTHGGRMVEFAGWQMPIQYTSIVEEHHAVRRQAGLFDIAHMGRLWFTGPDAVKFLDRIATNNVEKMPAGQIRYSLVCNDQGGILDDVLIYRFENECLMVVNASNREKILDWINAHQAGLDTGFTDRTIESCMIALQGPQAQELLQPHCDADLSKLKYYRATRGVVFGVAAVISRTGYTGEDGFELIVANPDAEGVWTKLLAAGPVLACGLGCRDTLRLEAAMPLYGHEMDENVDPLTAGLSFGVKLDKADFIGAASLRKIADGKPLPQRVGLELDGKRIARQGAELVVDGKSVGQVTSGTFSPTLEKSIAMGYLPEDAAAAGGTIEVDIRGKRESARIVPLPFYKRS